MEQTKFTRFKRIIFIILIVIFADLLTIGYCNNNSTYQQNPIEKINVIENVTIEDTVNSINQQKDSIEQLLISEVHKYIKLKTKKNSTLIPKYLVHAALNHDIDLCFMMAQTQIETCYGTLGAGRESSRRSLFGVAVRKYSNYENAIDDYCRILKKSYLGKGRNENHLMTKYVTHRGGRYAENPNYEKDLKIAYNEIKRSTKIYSLQQEIKNIF